MLRDVRLTDRYELESGQILISGTQALVRLLIEQRRRDERLGHDTAGYVSGYRGSPLGGFDQELLRSRTRLDAHRVRFHPAVNEDLAATAIWGTQQVGLFPGAKHQGVFALWYGKGPGVDRSVDALKHANRAGTSPLGGVVVAFGDDHTAESSTLAHQSEPALIAAMIPVLNPSSIADIIECGLLGWAMSRFSGLWVGLKCVSETVSTTATLQVEAHWPHVEVPELPTAAEAIHVRDGHEPLLAERRVLLQRLPRVLQFARANALNRAIFHGAPRRLGIVAAGQGYSYVREALEVLGFAADSASAAGIGLFKVTLSWPLEPHSLRDFASGYDEILFVEEKLPLIEDQAARILYDLPPQARPRLVGKQDESAAPLLPADAGLTREIVARALVSRLQRFGYATATPLGSRTTDHSRQLPPPSGAVRRPHFCAGCPHNRSTVVPAGSRALAGIGCSYMALWMDRATHASVHMGGEGANWIGAAPFSDTAHVFQNIGDGTYFHSGLLAIRASIAAGVNITYKVLYNDAVAMTGGQSVDGELNVPRLVRQVLAEGAKLVAIVSEHPARYAGIFRREEPVTTHPRSELTTVQERLRAISGTTVLVYDQMCAAERRRRRKRGVHFDPPTRTFINPAVCEGCGDCSVRSNCVSIVPLQTPLGRKRRIDQSSCNKDFSCVEGFCPAFVTIEGASLRKPQLASDFLEASTRLPQPATAQVHTTFNILIAGIGGTGVVTVGAILAMSAHLEGKQSSVSDMAGLAQKNGAVLSHVKVAARQEIAGARLERGDADLVLGCDLVVSASERSLSTMRDGRTRVVLNTNLVATGEFQRQPDIHRHAEAMRDSIKDAAGAERVRELDATTLCTSLFGDSQYTNVFVLGYACQEGFLPVGVAAIERAIELNAVEVEENMRAFRLGRLAHHDLQRLMTIAQPWWSTSMSELNLDDLIVSHANALQAYQSRRYAGQYLDFIARVRTREHALLDGGEALTRTVADSLFKLMAYKDEYEVARLHSDGQLMSRLASEFTGDYRVTFHLAPPVLSRPGAESRKRAFSGSWLLPVFAMLARMRFLRGTVLDVFGYSRERRMERALIGEYKKTVMRVLGRLDPQRLELARRLFSLPQLIRGFGHVKLAAVARVRTEEAALLKQILNAHTRASDG